MGSGSALAECFCAIVAGSTPSSTSFQHPRAPTDASGASLEQQGGRLSNTQYTPLSHARFLLGFGVEGRWRERVH